MSIVRGSKEEEKQNEQSFLQEKKKGRKKKNVRVTNYATKKQHIIILGPGAQ